MALWASEALAPPRVEVEVGAIEAGREESFGSVCNDIEASIARAG